MAIANNKSGTTIGNAPELEEEGDEDVFAGEVLAFFAGVSVDPGSSSPT